MDRIGAYRILGELGRGGMGVVYRAFDESLQREVALKLVLGLEPRARARLEREAAALAQLQHPGVARVHALGEHQGAPYLVMDYVAGTSLQAYLDRDGPFGLREALEITAELGEALRAVHAAGLLHRDLKPSNVLMTPRGRLVLIDFGLVKATHGDTSRRLTRTGQLLGTPGYWPPELARTEQDRIGPPTDVYGLAATLYALVTGHPPHEGESLIEVIGKLGEPAPPASSWNPELPPWLDAALAAALAPDPGARPATVAALLERLSAGPRPATGVRGPALVALGLVGLAALAGAAILQRGRTPAPPASPAAHPTPPAVDSPPAPPPDPETPSPPVADDAASLVARAGELREAGQLAEAAETLERAIQLDPRDPNAWVEGSLLRLQERDPRGARDALSQAISLAPEWYLPYENRGAIRFGSGDYAGAREDYQRALELAPDAERARDFEQELTAIAAEVARLPDQELDARGWFDRGQLERATDPALAERSFSRGLWLAPTHGPLRTHRAYAREIQGDLRGALRDLDRAVGDGFTHPVVHYNRATLRWKLQTELPGCVEDATIVLAADPDQQETRVTRAVALLTLGRDAEALADAEWLISRAPDFDRALYIRGMAKARLGQREAGVADLRRAIELAPDAKSRAAFQADLDLVLAAER